MVITKWSEVPEQVGRAFHKRAVLAPVVVSAMYRTKLLGDASMQQINRLYAVTCVASSFSWYVAYYTLYSFCMAVPQRLRNHMSHVVLLYWAG